MSFLSRQIARSFTSPQHDELMRRCGQDSKVSYDEQLDDALARVRVILARVRLLLALEHCQTIVWLDKATVLDELLVEARLVESRARCRTIADDVEIGIQFARVGKVERAGEDGQLFDEQMRHLVHSRHAQVAWEEALALLAVNALRE